mgnify:CR=1 FL=1
MAFHGPVFFKVLDSQVVLIVVILNDVLDKAGVVVFRAEDDVKVMRIVLDLILGPAIEVSLVVVHLVLGGDV